MPLVNLRFFPAAALVALLVAAGSTAVHGFGRMRPTVEPVIMLDGGNVSGCGMRAEAGSGMSRGMLEVTLRRRQKDTEFVISGRLAGSDGNKDSLTGLALVTASYDTRSLFPPPTATGPDTAETTARLDPSVGANFMREVIIGGAKITLSRAGAEPLTFELPMPMDLRVRATYLQCAGDLYRAGE